MSTYTHRYVEVLREQIDGYVWRMEELPNPQEHEGEIFKVTKYDKNKENDFAPYYEAECVCKDKHGEAFIWRPVYEVEKKWEVVKWYSYLPKNKVLLNKDPYYKPKFITATDNNGKEFFLEENILWMNNGGYVRDEYISTHAWGESAFAGRGLPKDVSKEVRKDIEGDYHYDMTYVTLSEWEAAFETARKDFEAKVYKRYAAQEKADVMKKLDDIYKAIKDPNYIPKKKKKTSDDEVYYEDTVEYLFEDEIWRLFNIRMEIDRTEFILEQFADWYDSGNVRIIYYLA